MAALAEQEHRGSVVAAAKRAQHARGPILVVQINVDHQAADQRVGGHDRHAVVGSAGDDDLEPPRTQFVPERACRASHRRAGDDLLAVGGDDFQRQNRRGMGPGHRVDSVPDRRPSRSYFLACTLVRCTASAP